MSKEVALTDRRREFFIKCFSEDAKQEFLQEIREVNKPGEFVQVVFMDKYDNARQVRYFEVEKLPYENSTWENLARECHLIADIQDNNNDFWEKLIVSCQLIEGAYFSWRERDCINATSPMKKVETA